MCVRAGLGQNFGDILEVFFPEKDMNNQQIHRNIHSTLNTFSRNYIILIIID
jgi:hypothetical protein